MQHLSAEERMNRTSVAQFTTDIVGLYTVPDSDSTSSVAISYMPGPGPRRACNMPMDDQNRQEMAADGS
jgi:hypothetical protein